MRAMIRFFILGVTLTLIVNSASAAGPWKGRIVDIETKEPIEGAVVLAVW